MRMGKLVFSLILMHLIEVIVLLLFSNVYLKVHIIIKIMRFICLVNLDNLIKMTQ